MIYFDNAATGGFKPDESLGGAYEAINELNANPGRSGHLLSEKAAYAVYGTRKKIAEFFNAESADRVIFTHNCTAALNAALFGTCKKGWHVITTITEHNSVLRPLYELERWGIITLTIVSPLTPRITADDLVPFIRPDTKLVAINSASNVTGEANDVSGIGKLVAGKDILYLVDGAQGGGHIPLDMKKNNIDFLCLAGHKGLMSIAGAGVLILGKNAEVEPFYFGGTGTETFSEFMPDVYPERLEAGTINLPAVLSLGGGMDYLSENFGKIQTSLISKTAYLVERLAKNGKIKLYSTPNACGIVSFSHSQIPSQELSGILSSAFGIATRGGFHCAPLMHKYLKTEKYGLLRASLSPSNTRKEIDALICALEKL